MKLWITILTACACLAFSANLLMAQAAEDPAPRPRRLAPRGADDRARVGDRAREGARAGRRDGEQAGRGPGQGQAGQRPPRPPVGPLLIALDRDKDGVISAREIAAASESLKKLDRNGDGKIDRVELRPHRPRGGQDGDAKGPRDGKGPQGGQDGDRRPPRGEGEGEGRRRGQRGPRDGNRRPPQPPAGPQE